METDLMGKNREVRNGKIEAQTFKGGREGNVGNTKDSAKVKDP